MMRSMQLPDNDFFCAGVKNCNVSLLETAYIIAVIQLVTFVGLLFATAVFFCWKTSIDISYRNHRTSLCMSHHLDGPCSFWAPGRHHSHPGH